MKYVSYTQMIMPSGRAPIIAWSIQAIGLSEGHQHVESHLSEVKLAKDAGLRSSQ